MPETVSETYYFFMDEIKEFSANTWRGNAIIFTFNVVFLTQTDKETIVC